MKLLIFVLLIAFFVGTGFTSSVVHFNDTDISFHKIVKKKDVQFLLSSSNETQTLNGYLLLTAGDPIKLKIEPFNLKKDQGPQDVILTLNTTSASTTLRFEYISMKLIIATENDDISYSCDSVCNKALDFKITSNGILYSSYNERLSSVALNQTMESEKTDDGKEKIYFNFEWSNNTVDFLVTVLQSTPIFSPEYLPHPYNPSFPAVTHEKDNAKNGKSDTWMWIVMLLLFATFGIITTFFCVRCRLSPTRQPQRYAVSTSSDDIL